MTTTKDRLDALRELYGTNNTEHALADHVQHLIHEGARLDAEARRARKRAGLPLLELRQKYPRDWKHRAGITPALAESLISMVKDEHRC